ncbi:alpha/beta fold hydrolase [Amycolatopsis jiangsuensis]|uniref:Pimeloyl-ACP methyl ester carboxylesterase n=1 Tax=Amycolatopsis jiangsuensis TaxID=1181879 RepID=A0A840J7R2_9PSEU|nr:hypothetical protein [Amycolatopsis jiangsuensis]MBB4689645.1 pimeloyl-ACP methyl ester carboxylesterase [Amycolatopsis jiangsuensis]
MWEEQVCALGTAGIRVVAPDQRGYSPGVRPEKASEYGVEQISDDALTMAKALAWRNLHLASND